MGFIPNTTPTPNWLYNGEMKKMNETELKVVLLVTRKTLGWFDPATGNQRKTQDYISQAQFIDSTGKSNRAIATAIQECVERGWIIARNRSGSICDSPERRARRKVWYQLGTIFTDKISGEESSSDDQNEENLVNIFPPSGEHFDTNLVKKVHYTKETIQKKLYKTLSKDNDAKHRILLTDECMSSIDDRDRSFPRKRTYGDEKIDWTLDYLEHRLGRPLGGQERWNRIYARHLANKYGMGNVKKLIEWLAEPGGWWYDKLSQVSTIYKKADQFFLEMKRPAVGANETRCKCGNVVPKGKRCGYCSAI